jgi:hypothetical protein
LRPDLDPFTRLELAKILVKEFPRYRWSALNVGGRWQQRRPFNSKGDAMGLRFYRRVSVIPGLRLNFSKRCASASVGRRGAWLAGPVGLTTIFATLFILNLHRLN